MVSRSPSNDQRNILFPRYPAQIAAKLGGVRYRVSPPLKRWAFLCRARGAGAMQDQRTCGQRHRSESRSAGRKMIVHRFNGGSAITRNPSAPGTAQAQQKQLERGTGRTADPSTARPPEHPTKRKSGSCRAPPDRKTGGRKSQADAPLRMTPVITATIESRAAGRKMIAHRFNGGYAITRDPSASGTA